MNSLWFIKVVEREKNIYYSDIAKLCKKMKMNYFGILGWQVVGREKR